MRFTFKTPLTAADRVLISQTCNQWPMACVEVREAKRTRSKLQNSFYWGCVIPTVCAMFHDAGQPVDPDDVHEYLKSEVGKLTRKLTLPDGETKTINGSTAKLSAADFENYLTAVRAWAAHYGCIIPMPNEF